MQYDRLTSHVNNVACKATLLTDAKKSTPVERRARCLKSKDLSGQLTACFIAVHSGSACVS